MAAYGRVLVVCRELSWLFLGVVVDWRNLVADENVWLNQHYSEGREGRSIEKIVLHHNAGVLSVQDCWNVWQSRQASAHYQVDVNGRVGQLVHDYDTAWHSGDWETNLRSIGIEHSNSGGAAEGWPVSGATVESGAHLVAALCLAYELGRPAWGVNVFPHQSFQSTACPGVLAGGLRDAYMARAGEWYDAMAVGQDAVPSSGGGESWRLEVDGVWGAHTARRFREVLRVPLDCPWGTALEAMRYALSWQLDAYKLRAAIGREDLNGASEGEVWGAFQAWYNASGIPEGHRIAVDGVYGPETVEAVQVTLNNSWAGSRGFGVRP